MCAREPKGTAHFLTSPKIPDAKGIFVMIQFTPVGDSGVLAVCGSEISEQVNAQVMALDAAVQAARTVNRQKVPVYQADLTMIQNTFMAALREVKKEIGNDFTAAQTLTKGITQQMFSELTKGQDVQAPTITPEMISAAVTQSAAGMDGVQKDALDKFGQALTEFLQSTLDHAQEKQNADPKQ